LTTWQADQRVLCFAKRPEEKHALITVRLAALADSAAIVALHTADVMAWERLAADGRLLSAAYADLSLYERWQHGGHWMSIETCAVHLNRLLAGAGTPLVATLDGAVLAHAELYEVYEAAPFGHHLELACIVVHPDHARRGLGSALIAYAAEMARLMRCERLTVAAPTTPAFYEQQAFRASQRLHSVRLSTGAGRVFYQSAPLSDRSPVQIKGWHMPLGRLSGARTAWDQLFPQDWAAGLPELLDQPTEHVHLKISGGQWAIFSLSAGPECAPGEAQIVCWSDRPLSGPLLAAIRDYTARKGYAALRTTVFEADLPLLGSDNTPIAPAQSIYELALH
jgi:GNAT superfamily N-acetyltransferase